MGLTVPFLLVPVPTMAEEADAAAAKQQFLDLQTRYIEASNQLKGVLSAIRRNDAEVKRSTLTLQELDDVPAETNIYKALGRSFVRSNKIVIIDKVNENIKNCQGELG